MADKNEQIRNKIKEIQELYFDIKDYDTEIQTNLREFVEEVNDEEGTFGNFGGELIQETAYGEVEGAKDSENEVLFWKGVPYGGNTSEENRWKKPSSPEKWEDTLDASEPGDVAIQMDGDEAIGSENALNLDIYRPDNSDKELPVFVYIHGGNNKAGDSGEITGNSFVNELDAIFISINHRLGPLGFNPLPALNTGDEQEDSGNYALLDIAESLDWINENIESFGGDANNITLSGFSAGGRNVMAMLVSPLFENKFQKAISFSGGMTIADKNDSAKVFAKSIAPLAVEDGEKETQEEAYKWLLSTDSTVKDYLYTLSAERLSSLMTDAGIRMSVFPHLYNDGVILPKEGFDTEDYNSVALLMSTGSNEFSVFASGDPYLEEKDSYDFASRHGGELYGSFNVNDSAEKMIDNYDADIYGTEIQFGDDPDVVSPEFAEYGAFHGVFSPLLDNTSDKYTDLIGDFFETEGATDLSKTFKAYIANFLKTGNPNDEDLVEWESWTKENQENKSSILILDADKEEATHYMSSEELTQEDILNNLENDDSISAENKKDIIKNVLNGRWFSNDLDEKYQNPSLWVD